MNKLQFILEQKRIDLGLNKLEFVKSQLHISYQTYQALIKTLPKNKNVDKIQINSLNKVSKFLGISNSELIKLINTDINTDIDIEA